MDYNTITEQAHNIYYTVYIDGDFNEVVLLSRSGRWDNVIKICVFSDFSFERIGI